MNQGQQFRKSISFSMQALDENGEAFDVIRSDGSVWPFCKYGGVREVVYPGIRECVRRSDFYDTHHASARGACPTSRRVV